MKLFSNRIFQLIIYALYIVLGTIGVVFSYVGWRNNLHNEFYVFFTNQSNVIAVILVTLLLVKAIIDISKDIKVTKDSNFVTFSFCVFIYQSITMVLYNFFTPNGHIFTAKFWSTVQCPVLHLFAPLLFVFIFIAFMDKTKISKYAPLYVAIYPFLYALFILIRSYILRNEEDYLISGYKRFPYPIFDYETYPFWLVLIFMLIGLTIFIGLGYLLKFLFQRKTKSPRGAN